MWAYTVSSDDSKAATVHGKEHTDPIPIAQGLSWGFCRPQDLKDLLPLLFLSVQIVKWLSKLL